jgi:hypothetical protein
MNTDSLPADPNVTTLMLEVKRYLAAVDAFRAEGHEPRWSPECTGPAAASRRRRGRGLEPS